MIRPCRSFLTLCGLLAAIGGPVVSAKGPSLFQIDHLLIGSGDLDRATEQVAEATGVRPAHGGKHPIGTHNALLALGEGTYLELIAAQPGARPVAFFVDFAKLGEVLQPVGWAVAVRDLGAARSALEKAGFAVTPELPGSRITPAGATLSWQTFALVDGPEQAPFFIVWAADSPHPATTSPPGCQLAAFAIAGPDATKLEALRAVLGVDVKIVAAATPSMRVELACPTGRVVYEGGRP